MKYSSKLLLWGTLSVGVGIGAGYAIESVGDSDKTRSADKLEACAESGLTADGCRDIIEKQVKPEIIENDMGYVAVYSAEQIEARSREVRDSSDGAMEGIFIGGYVFVFSFIGGIAVIMGNELRRRNS